MRRSRVRLGRRQLGLAFGLIFPFVCSGLSQPVDIVFWHSMAGQLGEQVRLLAEQFNASQHEVTVRTVFKGDYTESLTSYAAAFRAKNPPQLIQVFEVGTASMLIPQGIIKPVADLMKEQGLPLRTDHFFPAVKDTYSVQQRLVALPFNVSVPIMFYNADALARVGVTASTFPRTWVEFEALAKRLRQAGHTCVYTSTYPSWVLIESYLALHGLPFVDAVTGKAAYNNPAMLRQLKRLRRWQRLHYFEYGGRTDDSTVLFTSGKCPIISQSSGSYAGLSAMVPFQVGVASIPLDSSVSKVRQNNVVGGAAIWVTAGQSSNIEHGIARFLAFLAQPQIQRYWFEHTGYLPLDRLLIQGSDIQPATPLAIAAFDLNQTLKPAQPTPRGPQNQIRTINDQMLEAIFSGMMPPEAAMERAITRSNHALQRFQCNTHQSCS